MLHCLMEKNFSISVIVPFFNEEITIEESVNSLVRLDVFKEIILVDNCSTDNSRKIVDLKFGTLENVIIISAFEKQGKGYCLQKGLTQVTSTHVVVHDADLEYNPQDLREMISLAIYHPDDLILGSRIIGKKNRINKYFYTKFFNKVFSLYFSILNIYRVSDISTCYQINSLSKLKQMNIEEIGFGIEVEILSKNIKMGYKILEVPIEYSGRTYREGKKIKILDAISIFYKILKYSKLNFFF